MRKTIVLLLVVLMAVAAGCGGKDVKRVGTDTTIDLSGRWNDADSRMVSEEMIQDVLNRPWLKKFVRKHGGNAPVVIVGTIRNRSQVLLSNYSDE